MAEVFEAELTGELGFQRKVALKRMLADVARDGELAKRFLDEARIASRLHHANIVAILDMGLLDGMPFQVLELVDGIDAQQLRQRAGELPVEVALIIAIEIAHALDHAHTARDAAGIPLSIVHRDVKPSNVLVSWAGDVKLTDFGIAFARDRVVKTEAGLVPGTMGYMAPEQRTKSAIDGRTDVFALGLTLHALLAGYTPLQNVEVEMALLAGTPLPLDPALPADLREVIARAVEPDKSKRLTAVQLADALGGILAMRLSRDPRGYLRAFLGQLDERKPKGGLLDQLLGLEVVLTKEGNDEAPRHYHLRETVAGTPDAVARAEAATVRDAPAPKRSRRRRGAAIALFVIGTGGFAAWELTRSSTARETVRVDAPVAVAAVDASTADMFAPAPDAPLVTKVPVDAKIAPLARPTHRVVDAGAPTTGTGFLQVTGEDNIGAKILVDGREIGYAPNKLEVPHGRHTMTIVRKDGTQQTADIDVTEYHTVQHPLRP